jgi:hypothetical protein
MDNNILLVTTFLTCVYGSYYTSQKGKGIPFFTNAETTIKGLKFFGFMVMYETIFGKFDSGIVEVPKNLSTFLEKKPLKWFSIYMIAFASTGDIEQSVFLTIGFLVFVHLWRTPEERKKYPYLL